LRKPKITAIGGGHVGVTAALRLVDSLARGIVALDAFATHTTKALSSGASGVDEVGGARPVRRGSEEL